MAERFASVLIPTRAPGPAIEQVLNAVFQQRPGFDFEVVIVDSGSPDADLDRMRRFPLTLHRIPPYAFRHGRTRNLLAHLSGGQVLLYLSQDAEPASVHWMERLVAPLRDPKVAGAYARQLPSPTSSLLTRFFLQDIYGEIPQCRRIHPPTTRVSIRDIFFSNASSAISRDVWRRIPFRDKAVMSEDQFWAFDVLRAGFHVVYEPAASVHHSHDYSLKTLFHRNRLSGASLRELVCDSPSAMARGWLDYVRHEFAFLRRHRASRLLPYALIYEVDRAIAFSIGIWASRPAGVTELNNGRSQWERC